MTMQPRRRRNDRAGGAFRAVVVVAAAVVFCPPSASVADACFASGSFPAIYRTTTAATAPSPSTTLRCGRRRPFPPPAYAMTAPPCPRPAMTRDVRLRASNWFGDGDDDDDEDGAVRTKEKRRSDNEKKEQTRSKIVGGGSMIRNRKIKVDRTNLYTDEDYYDDFNVDEYCWLDDDGNMQGESCLVSDSADSFPSPPKQPGWFDSEDFSLPSSFIDVALRYIPVVCPLLAFQTYTTTARAFAKVMQFLSNNNWVAVDGGQYQIQIITPAINGIVVPSIALLFATLTSTTINTLRQRQLEIRTILNTEANDLQMLVTMIDTGFTIQGDRRRHQNSWQHVDEESERIRQGEEEIRAVRNQLRSYLVQYASRVIAESMPGSTLVEQETIGSMDSEINGFLGVLNRVNVDGQTGVIPRRIPDVILCECYDAMTRLRAERSTRMSALQSTFPPLHYAILLLLAGSISTAFLMETDQEILIFLSAIQLRLLWAMLIGTFSALAVVNYDMIDPFRGNYNVAVSVDQFYTIREAIRASIKLDAAVGP